MIKRKIQTTKHRSWSSVYRAAQLLPKDQPIYIVMSRCFYYLEDGRDSAFVRSWEALIYEGEAGKVPAQQNHPRPGQTVR